MKLILMCKLRCHYQNEFEPYVHGTMQILNKIIPLVKNNRVILHKKSGFIFRHLLLTPKLSRIVLKCEFNGELFRLTQESRSGLREKLLSQGLDCHLITQQIPFCTILRNLFSVENPNIF